MLKCVAPGAFCLMLILAGCAAPKPVQAPVDSLQRTIDARLGTDAVATKNKSGSFVLYTKEEVNPVNNMPVMRYLIVRMYDKKVVEEGGVTMATIGWVSDFELEISPAAGQPQLAREGNSPTRRIDLRKYIVNGQ